MENMSPSVQSWAKVDSKIKNHFFIVFYSLIVFFFIYKRMFHLRVYLNVIAYV